jgi:hemerythrin-like domain-containing protein
MIEHRLNYRMVNLFNRELERIGDAGSADQEFIDSAVGYMLKFADICHHGKEEKILFPRLAEKPLDPEIKKTMEDLIQEHILMRKITNDLVQANKRYIQNDIDSKADIIASINDIIELYPAHMEKEDRHFFLPAMGYLTDREKDDMLDNFFEFDSRLFHDGYMYTVAALEERWGIKSRHH